MDELAHIPAGYGYVHNFDFRLNPEHPPLVKAFSALPLLFLNLNFPTQSSYWTEDINGQWAIGTQFLYNSGNDATLAITWARMVPILLSILLIILIYLWSRQLLGNLWALLPTFIFALSPTVLAHGHYVATDIGATFGIVIATYYFLEFLRRPSRRRLIYAGLAFGVAQLTKFSTVLLIPYFAILLLVFYLVGVIRDWPQTEIGTRSKRFAPRGLRYLKSLIVIFALGYILVVYPVYFLFTVNYPAQKQTADTTFILNSFAGGPTPESKLCSGARCLADLNIWMTKNAVTRPFAQYMLGILMVLQRSAGGNTSYFLGQVSAAGSRLYFPFVYLVKEPLPILIMVLSAFICAFLGVVRKIKSKLFKVKNSLLDYLELHFTEFSMAVFVLMYWAWSIESSLNIGFRHLLPTLPFIYILTASVWKKWVVKLEFNATASGLKLFWLWFKAMLSASLKYLFTLVLIIWFFLETLFAAPYFLSYFNELGGGVWGGYRYVTDSNYDWGQDLLRLRQFVDTHTEIDKIAVDYFGGGNPKYYLGDKEEDWWSSRGNPAEQGIHWLAISVNTLQGATEPLAPGQGRKPEDEYRWLTELRPPTPGLGNVPAADYRAGTSIFIYKL